ncbi:hypothetical protein J4206_05140 [Candidatus Woesearchaeota archaeon]|nr:hypothetical protein [Candidatus Woesearchaeota archaeon]
MAYLSLVERLKQIDQIPEFVTVDKAEEQRKILEKARAEHPLVEEAINGRFLFGATVEELAQRYKGLRKFLPNFYDPKHDQEISELNLSDLLYMEQLKSTNDAFNGPDNQFSSKHPYIAAIASWIYNKAVNPVVLPLALGGLFALVRNGDKVYETEWINQVFHFSQGAAMGAFFGIALKLLERGHIGETIDNARYLDTTIRNLYKQDLVPS